MTMSVSIFSRCICSALQSRFLHNSKLFFSRARSSRLTLYAAAARIVSRRVIKERSAAWWEPPLQKAVNPPQSSLGNFATMDGTARQAVQEEVPMRLRNSRLRMGGKRQRSSWIWNGAGWMHSRLCSGDHAQRHEKSLRPSANAKRSVMQPCKVRGKTHQRWKNQ
jgi:hypothetical protein